MTDTPASAADKAAIRARALARRDGLNPKWRARASRAAAEAGAGLPVEPGQIVSGFVPIRSEIDPGPLLDQLANRGALLALPAVVDRDTIVFRRFDPDAPLMASGFGTMAPPDDAPTCDPDILIVPLAAFDALGHRIGYGAGHYDRAIAEQRARGLSPRLIGLAFACQQEPAIPFEAHDVRLHTVLTEKGMLNFPAGGH